MSEENISYNREDFLARLNEFCENAKNKHQIKFGTNIKNVIEFICENNKYPSQYATEPNERKLGVFWANCSSNKTPEKEFFIEGTSKYAEVTNSLEALDKVLNFIKENDRLPKYNAESTYERYCFGIISRVNNKNFLYDTASQYKEVADKLEVFNDTVSKRTRNEGRWNSTCRAVIEYIINNQAPIPLKEKELHTFLGDNSYRAKIDGKLTETQCKMMEYVQYLNNTARDYATKQKEDKKLEIQKMKARRILEAIDNNVKRTNTPAEDFITKINDGKRKVNFSSDKNSPEFDEIKGLHALPKHPEILLVPQAKQKYCKIFNDIETKEK